MEVFKPEDFLEDDVSIETIRSLPYDYIQDKVVLGIDIYKYSQYPAIE